MCWSKVYSYEFRYVVFNAQWSSWGCFCILIEFEWEERFASTIQKLLKTCFSSKIKGESKLLRSQHLGSPDKVGRLDSKCQLWHLNHSICSPWHGLVTNSILAIVLWFQVVFFQCYIINVYFCNSCNFCEYGAFPLVTTLVNSVWQVFLLYLANDSSAVFTLTIFHCYKFHRFWNSLFLTVSNLQVLQLSENICCIMIQQLNRFSWFCNVLQLHVYQIL